MKIIKRGLQVLILSLIVAVSASAFALDVDGLIDKLRNGEDFRVRVRAALELGKKDQSIVRVPLERALKDDSAAVRAAAAAALLRHGDPRAIDALTAARKDSSAAVRQQVKASIAGLKARRPKPKTKAPKGVKVLLQVGKTRDGAKVKSRRIMRELKRSSKEQLKSLPGVMIDDGNVDAKRLPILRVDTRLSKLDGKKRGGTLVVSARVEYVLYEMPGRSIKGRVSGTASAKATRRQARSKSRIRRLKRRVMLAAVQSAMRRAPEAIEAASAP